MFYMIVRWVVNVVLKVLFDIESQGFENFPQSGPAVLCCNHMSWWDPCVLGCLAPRPIYFMAKRELFENKLFAWVLRNLHAFPVKREKVDIGTVRKGLAVLEEGNILGMFPEGTRRKSPEISQAHAGAALFAIKAQVPVIPVAIKGTYSFRNKIRVACGEPFYLDCNTGKLSSDLKQGSEQIMGAIVGLWNGLDLDEAV